LRLFSFYLPMMKQEICPLCRSENTAEFLEIRDPHSDLKLYRKCPECRLVFLEPRFHLSPEEEKRRYDTHQNSPEDSGYVNFLSRLTGPLTERLTPGAAGLDFGCGPGPALGIMLEKKGFSVENYDLYYFPDARLLERDYDFIACTEVMEHLRSPRAELELFAKLLERRRGKLGIMTQMFVPGTDFSKWYYRLDPTHIAFYSYDTLNWIAEWLDWKLEFSAPNVAILNS